VKHYGASIILRSTARFLLPLLLLFAVFLLLRGHNEPGGGFVGGLFAAIAFVLYALAYDASTARQALMADPRTLVGLGLLLAAASGLLPLLLGSPFLTGVWHDLHTPMGDIHLGTPVFFDIGVFFVVVGVTLTIILGLIEE
jgi:multicomponent Na+:H+ antiporter subunit B